LSDDFMPIKDADSIRVTITLEQEIYDRIKETSRQMGLRPATWISMVATSKMNNVDVRVEENGGEQDV